MSLAGSRAVLGGGVRLVIWKELPASLEVVKMLKGVQFCHVLVEVLGKLDAKLERLVFKVLKLIKHNA